jgi:hypothetical protein
MFTVNKIPIVENEEHKNVGAKALYQYKWGSTVASNILLGARYIKQAPSLLWNQNTCSISDFNEGIKLLTAALPTMIQVIQGSNLPFDKKILQNMQMILNKQKGKFILTEFTEIASMKIKKSKKINKINLITAKEAIKFAREIKKVINIRNDKKRIQEFIKVLEKFKKTEHSDMGLLGFTDVTNYGP